MPGTRRARARPDDQSPGFQNRRCASSQAATISSQPSPFRSPRATSSTAPARLPSARVMSTQRSGSPVPKAMEFAGIFLRRDDVSQPSPSKSPRGAQPRRGGVRRRSRPRRRSDAQPRKCNGRPEPGLAGSLSDRRARSWLHPRASVLPDDQDDASKNSDHAHFPRLAPRL